MMSNTTPFFRQKAILAIVKQKPFATFSEIETYVNSKLEQQLFVDDKTKPSFSKRTFERDLKDIEQIYGAVILFDKKERGYFVESTSHDKALD